MPARKEQDSPLNIGAAGSDVDDSHEALAVGRDRLDKVGDLDRELAGGDQDHCASGLVVWAGRGGGL